MGQPNTSARPRRTLRLTAAAAALLAVSTGCGMVGSSASADRLQLDPINVSSPGLKDSGPLPVDYSCNGDEGNPPLHWSGVPSTAAKSFAIVVDNNSRDGAEVHWVVFDIDPRTSELAKNSVPAGAVEGRTTSGKVGYVPPCRTGENYRFTVYALSGKIGLGKGAPLAETLARIAERTIARGRLTTAYIE